MILFLVYAYAINFSCHIQYSDGTGLIGIKDAPLYWHLLDIVLAYNVYKTNNYIVDVYLIFLIYFDTSLPSACFFFHIYATTHRTTSSYASIIISDV